MKKVVLLVAVAAAGWYFFGKKDDAATGTTDLNPSLANFGYTATNGEGGYYLVYNGKSFGFPDTPSYNAYWARVGKADGATAVVHPFTDFPLGGWVNADGTLHYS